VILDPIIIVLIMLTFLLAGTVKGVIGLGLPTVSLGLLTAALDLTTAMALLLIPSLFTNLWQGFVGGHTQTVLRRIWPFLLMATLTVWIGGLALTRFDLSGLSLLLGLLLITYGLTNLLGWSLKMPPEKETWAGPLAGLANGILTGMTGSFVVPGVIYLQSIGLPRDQMIQAMGLLFSASTLALGITLGSSDLLSHDVALTSAAALIPALIGMVLGGKLRRYLSEDQFRRLFFWALLVLGLYIAANALPLVFTV